MLRILVSCALLLLLSVSCKKENYNQQIGIPHYDVDQYVLLNNPTSITLNAVGGFLYQSGGSRGIVVYHRTYDEYVAFDRHCTWQPQETCGQVVIDSSTSVILNCPCCDSRFSLIDGSVLHGPATFPLLQYNAQLSDPATLHIYN